MAGVSLDIENAKASTPREGFIPNPKLKLLDQVSEVMRFKRVLRVSFESDAENWAFLQISL